MEGEVSVEIPTKTGFVEIDTLSVGEFFGELSKKKDYSKLDLSIKRNFDKTQSYNFNTHIIKELLKDSYKSKEITLFEYFVEFNSFRGICMAMVEALRLESPFKEYMKSRLKSRYEDFFDITSFVRNVLSHNIHAQIKLNEKDYSGTLKRIRRMKRQSDIFFDFNYARDLPEIGSPDINYGFTCRVDFKNLKEGMPFLDIISHWELMMLSELCFNLVMAYRITKQNFISN